MNDSHDKHSRPDYKWPSIAVAWADSEPDTSHRFEAARTICAVYGLDVYEIDRVANLLALALRRKALTEDYKDGGVDGQYYWPTLADIDTQMCVIGTRIG